MTCMLTKNGLSKESSKERKFQGAKVPHLELSLPGANGLGSEKSIIHVLDNTVLSIWVAADIRDSLEINT